MALVLDIASWALLMAGVAFGIVGGIGMLRLPDLFTRMHAAGLIDTLAVALVAFGLMLQAGWTIVTIKLAIILLFIFFTSPTGTHALAKAALHGGVKPQTRGGALLENRPGDTLESMERARDGAPDKAADAEAEKVATKASGRDDDGKPA